MTELLFTGEQLGRLALQFLLAGAGTLSFAILFAFRCISSRGRDSHRLHSKSDHGYISFSCRG